MTPSVIRFSYPSLGDDPAHDDRLHLSARFRHRLFSGYAWRLEKSPSSHALLAHLYAGCSSRTQNLTRDGEVDTSLDYLLAFFQASQSHLLERPFARQLDGSGPHRHPATPHQPHHLSYWRWQPGRQTWGQKSSGSERPKKQISPLVFRYPLCVAHCRLGRVSHSSWLSPHFAQASSRLSKRKCLVSRDGG